MYKITWLKIITKVMNKRNVWLAIMFSHICWSNLVNKFKHQAIISPIKINLFTIDIVRISIPRVCFSLPKYAMQPFMRLISKWTYTFQYKHHPSDPIQYQKKKTNTKTNPDEQYWKTKTHKINEGGGKTSGCSTNFTYWPGSEVWFVHVCSFRPASPKVGDDQGWAAGCSGSATMACSAKTSHNPQAPRRWASLRGTRSWHRPGGSPKRTALVKNGICHCWPRAVGCCRIAAAAGCCGAASSEGSALWWRRSRTWRWWLLAGLVSTPTGLGMVEVEARVWCEATLCCPRSGLPNDRGVSRWSLFRGPAKFVLI